MDLKDKLKKRIEQVVVDGNAIKSGEISYSASFTELNNTLFNISNSNYSPYDGWLYSGKFIKGFTDWFSAYLGQSYLLNSDTDAEDIQLYTLGANVNIFNNLLLSSNFSIDNNHQKITRSLSKKFYWQSFH